MSNFFPFLTIGISMYQNSILPHFIIPSTFLPQADSLLERSRQTDRFQHPLFPYEFNANNETEVDEFHHHVENVPYATILSFCLCFSQLTSRFPLTMVAGGFGPYHRLWTDDACSKRKVVTPTSGGMMPALGFVS